ncbi:MAG: C_GCAxxG_C_C family protein [Lachnospiraceae bacterium]|nr:C_GCAxxG_C_C family protein [Lachnospiraceae bacterium]
MLDVEVYVARAAANHDKQYNCSQAVACAFCDAIGADERTLFTVMEGFGGGMGAKECVCGAISGAVAAVSMKRSTGCLEAPNSKKETYALTSELLAKFVEKNGSYVCKELRGDVEGGQMLRSCPGCIEDATRLAYETLKKIEEA